MVGRGCSEIYRESLSLVDLLDNMEIFGLGSWEVHTAFFFQLNMISNIFADKLINTL
jgi:hypothetical protein